MRIGNGAYQQLQLDIYGELMDSLYLYNKYGTPISYDLWNYLRRLTDWVCKHWQDNDDAIWEVRGRSAPVRLLQDDELGGRGSRVAVGRQALLSRGLERLDVGSRPDLRDHHEARLERAAWRFCAAVRRRSAGCVHAPNAAGVLRLAHRSAHAPNHRRDQPVTPSRRSGVGRPGVSLRRRKNAGWFEGHRRHIQSVHVLAGGGARRAPGPSRLGACGRRACCSSRCSDTPITWACTPSRSAIKARRSGIFRKRSLTWR